MEPIWRYSTPFATWAETGRQHLLSGLVSIALWNSRSMGTSNKGTALFDFPYRTSRILLVKIVKKARKGILNFPLFYQNFRNSFKILCLFYQKNNRSLSTKLSKGILWPIRDFVSPNFSQSESLEFLIWRHFRKRQTREIHEISLFDPFFSKSLLSLIRITHFNFFSVDPLSKIGFGDGFYLESLICFVLGMAWVHFIFPRLRHLQSLPTSAWAVPKSSQKTD